MQSLNIALARMGGGYWTGGPGLRRGSRRRPVPLATSQNWAGASVAGLAWGAPARRRGRAAWRAAATIFLAAVGVYGLAVGGHLEQMRGKLADGTVAMALRAGFAVQQLTIEGQRNASRNDILAALGIGAGESMLSIDTAAAQARLERVAWVRRARVMRLLPSTLHVIIEEREPFAVWQRDGVFRLVAADGVVLGPANGDAASTLPLIVGEGAAEAAPGLFRALAAHPWLRGDMVAAVRVGDRRWNLKLAAGVEVRLPEDNVERALDTLAELDSSHAILTTPIESVDLRLADRVTVRLSPAAAAQWAEMVKRGERSRAGIARET